MSDDPSGQSAQIEALQAEVARKEDVILKMQRGEARREDMAQQIRDIAQDRDHWKSMSEKGSKSQARKITDLQNKLVQSESKNSALEAERDAAVAIRELQARIAALHAERDAAQSALATFIYETTHLSPEEDDGSHWCKISKECLEAGRRALSEGEG